jgi:hypothetical protein
MRMNGFLRAVFLGLAWWLGAVPVRAAEPREELRVVPDRLELRERGPGSRVTALRFSGGICVGMAEGVRFESSDPRVLEVGPDGELRSRSPGECRVRAYWNQESAETVVRVLDTESDAGWSFVRHVLPVLSKANCNGGGCHGAVAGKGGFRLSLSGYDPAADHLSITREALGRRIECGDPLRSLLLTKPTAAAPHKGGRRLDTGSRDYRLLAEWIAGGAEGPRAAEAALERIEVIPSRWRLPKGGRARLLVQAHYADGRVEDVTRWAKFASTDESLLRLSDSVGGVEVVGYGEGAVTAWFSSRIVMSRVQSPFPAAAAVAGDGPSKTPWRAGNPVDESVRAQLKDLRLEASPLCDDATFLRRIHLDLTGLPPTPEQVLAFLQDPSAGKRDAVIDRLLGSSEYTDYWAYRWSDVFLVNSAYLRPEAVKRYYQWLRGEVERNTPWDQLVRNVLTARGGSLEEGATNFFAVHQEPESMAENVSQAFMGLSINCAKCHNHPLEKWTNDQYYAFANLFARVRAKGWGGDVRSGDGKRTLYNAPMGEVLQPRTGRVLPAAPLDGAPVTPEETRDRREILADWMTAPSNPYFTRTIANRIWAAFFGVGVVNAVDDLRLSNPATNEALMEALCAHLVKHRYDLKELMRMIVQSATYQRSSEVLPANRADGRYFSRYYPRRLMAEVLCDAIGAATGVPEEFSQVQLEDGELRKTEFYPKGTRALQLYDSAVRSYFLRTFGRNARAITCDCERSNQPSVVQALHLSNGSTLNGKLGAKEGAVSALMESAQDWSRMVESVFLRCLSRLPTDAERASYEALFKEVPEPERRSALEDLFWALLTSREFLFQH